MIEVFHFWGSDLAVSAGGDIALATDTIASEQRVLRRLLTNPQLVDNTGLTQVSGDYIFHPTYGAGLPRYVGSPADIPGTTAVITSQLLQEEAVSNSPAPVITVTGIQSGVNAYIRYNDASTQQPVVLDFDVNK